MKTKSEAGKADGELKSEYDLASLLKGAVVGKYADSYRAGSNIVRLAPDVARAFPTEGEVNSALRMVMECEWKTMRLDLNVCRGKILLRQEARRPRLRRLARRCQKTG